MKLFELFERIPEPKEAVLNAALAALHRRVSSKGDQQTIDGYAFDIVRSFDVGMSARQLAALYRERYTTNEGYRLQLERDDAILVLNITNTDTGKRTEVRGKPGYETSGYDPNDKLHILLDKIGKTANISELINGETVTINPKHPDAERAKSATDRAFNEAFDTDVEWVLDHNERNLQIFATKVDDAYIELSYKRIFPADVYIEFTRGGRLGVTGEGSQNKIFGAVINHIKQWVAKNNPPKIMFSALKLYGDTSRSNLYKRMVQRFADQNGYEFEVQDTGNEDTFILTKQTKGK